MYVVYLTQIETFPNEAGSDCWVLTGGWDENASSPFFVLLASTESSTWSWDFFFKFFLSSGILHCDLLEGDTMKGSSSVVAWREVVCSVTEPLRQAAPSAPGEMLILTLSLSLSVSLCQHWHCHCEHCQYECVDVTTCTDHMQCHTGRAGYGAQAPNITVKFDKSLFYPPDNVAAVTAVSSNPEWYEVRLPDYGSVNDILGGSAVRLVDR